MSARYRVISLEFCGYPTYTVECRQSGERVRVHRKGRRLRYRDGDEVVREGGILAAIKRFDVIAASEDVVRGRVDEQRVRSTLFPEARSVQKKAPAVLSNPEA